MSLYGVIGSCRVWVSSRRNVQNRWDRGLDCDVINARNVMKMQPVISLC